MEGTLLSLSWLVSSRFVRLSKRNKSIINTSVTINALTLLIGCQEEIQHVK